MQQASMMHLREWTFAILSIGVYLALIAMALVARAELPDCLPDCLPDTQTSLRQGRAAGEQDASNMPTPDASAPAVAPLVPRWTWSGRRWVWVQGRATETQSQAPCPTGKCGPGG